MVSIRRSEAFHDMVTDLVVSDEYPNVTAEQGYDLVIEQPGARV